MGLEPDVPIGEIIEDGVACPVRQPGTVDDESCGKRSQLLTTDHCQQRLPFAIGHMNVPAVTQEFGSTQNLSSQTGGVGRAIAVTIRADFIRVPLGHGRASDQNLHLLTYAGFLERIDCGFHGRHRCGE